MASKITNFAFSLCLFLLTSSTVFSAPNEFTIKGNVKNNTSGYWEFGLSTFYDQEMISVVIDKNGNFRKTVVVKGPQDIFIRIGKGISFFVVPGDIITLNWDANDEEKTFDLHSDQLERQTEINLVYKNSLKNRSPFSQLFTDMMSKALTTDEKFEKVNNTFRDEISGILSHGKPTAFAEKILADIYFMYTVNFLDNLNEESKKTKTYSLVLNDLLEAKDWQKFKKIDTAIDNESLFKSSRIYRVFLVNKVRSFNPSSYVYKISSSGQFDTPVKYALAGKELIKSKTILEWYQTLNLLDCFGLYDFENAERAYNLYAHEISDPLLIDTLTKFHTKINKLKPGSPAPNFTLKDLDGKSVSLSDFKGKVVYIDFWGIYCSPCLAEIKNYAPLLKKKYADKDVVFLNICIDTDSENDWQRKVKEVNFEGVNLIVTNRSINPVIKDYNISGIPHYILIDRQGNIVSATALRPSRLSQKSNNDLDKALSMM